MRTQSLIIFAVLTGLLAGIDKTAGQAAVAGAAQSDSAKLEIEFIARPYKIFAGRQGENLNISRDNLFYIGFRMKGGMIGTNFPLISYFKKMTEDMPKGDVETEQIYEMFRSGKHLIRFEYLMGVANPNNVEDHEYQVELAAPKMELAKKMIEVFLEVCNHDWKENRESVLLKDLENSKSRILTLQAELKKQQDEQAAVNETLKGIPIEGLKTGEELKVKFALLDVDAAGTKAKIAAAENFMKMEKEAAEAQKSQIEMIKTTAQIDLAGLLAQQQRISEILAAIDRLSKSNPPGISQTKWELELNEAHVKALESAINKPAILFQVVGKAEIQPIDWTSQSQEAMQPRQ